MKVLVVIYAGGVLAGCASSQPAAAPAPTCESPGVAIAAKLLPSRSIDDLRREFAEWIAPGVPAFRVATGPALTNGDEVARALHARYPANLRDRGIGGTTVFAVLIDTKGVIRRRQLLTSSAEPRLDQAAESVLSMMRHRPMLAPDGCAIQFMGEFPIAFRSSADSL